MEALFQESFVKWYIIICCCFLVSKSGLILCDPVDCMHHTRCLCSSLSPTVCSNSCSFSWWCYPTISSSGAPFSFCLWSFLASGSFPLNWLFASGGQSIGASSSVLPMSIQDWFPLGLTGLNYLQTLKNLLQHHSSKASILWCSAFMVQV